MSKSRKPRNGDAPNPPATPAEEALVLSIAKTMAKLTERGDAIAESDERHQKVKAKETEAIIIEIYRSIQPIWNNDTLVRRALTAIPLPTNKMNRQKPPYGFVKQALRRHKHKSQWTRYTNALCIAYAGVPHPEKRPMTADEFEAEVQQLGGLNPFHDKYVPKPPPPVSSSTKSRGNGAAGDTAAVASPSPQSTAMNMVSGRLSEQLAIPPGVLACLEPPIEGTPLRRFLAEVEVDKNGRQPDIEIQQRDDAAAASLDAPKKTTQKILLVSVDSLSDFAIQLQMLLKQRGHDPTKVIIECRVDASVANIAGFDCLETESSSTPPATEPFSEASESAEPQSPSNADLPVNGGNLTPPSPPVPITAGGSVGQVKPLPDIRSDQSNCGDGANPANSGGEEESTVDGAASLVPPAPPKDQEPPTPHHPVVNETEGEHNAKVLRVIRQWYMDGTATSISAASKGLKKDGLRPFKGGQFHYENLKKLLNDADYADLAALSKANLGDDSDPDGDGDDDPEPDDDGGGSGRQQPKTETTPTDAGRTPEAPRVNVERLVKGSMDAGRTPVSIGIDPPQNNGAPARSIVPSSFVVTPWAKAVPLVADDTKSKKSLNELPLKIRKQKWDLVAKMPAAIAKKIILAYEALVYLSRQGEPPENIPASGKIWRIIAKLFVANEALTIRLKIWGQEYKSTDILVSKGLGNSIEIPCGDTGHEYNATHLVRMLKELLNIKNKWSGNLVADVDVALLICDHGIQMICKRPKLDVLLGKSEHHSEIITRWLKNQRHVWTKGRTESPAARIQVECRP
ncbi:MAG: hypothetical protein WCJ64_01440 [Rhodospirillaceae bacterium]